MQEKFSHLILKKLILTVLELNYIRIRIFPEEMHYKKFMETLPEVLTSPKACRFSTLIPSGTLRGIFHFFHLEDHLKSSEIITF